MFVSHRALNGQHLATDLCLQGEEWKWCHLADEEARAGAVIVIKAYRIPLSPVSYFRYLGIVISVFDNNWTEVVQNLKRLQQKWSQLTRVLGR